MGLNSSEIICEYIKNVCSLVKNKDAHEEIKLELENHILELSDELIVEGAKESEATEKAIAQMGDASVVGSQLNMAHKGNPDWTLLIITLLLSGFGLLSMYFIKISGLASEEVFYKNLGYFIIGIVMVVGIYFFDYRKLRKYSKYIYIASLIFTLLATFTGPVSYGRVHLSIFFVIWNFIDLSVFILIISLCGIFSEWDFSKLENKLKGIALLTVPLIIIILSQSVSAAAIYVISFIVLLFSSRANYKYILLIICSLLGLPFYYTLSEPYRTARMLAFFNPQADSLGMGYMIIQVKKLLIGAGFFGKGLTLTKQALPQADTDFIFAYIIYTFGWFAGLSIVALASAFVVRIVTLAASVKDTYGKLLIKGIASIFAVEFAWNILMVLGFAPIVGLSLPFISYGGSQFIMNMVAIGLISSVYKRRTLAVSVKVNS